MRYRLCRHILTKGVHCDSPALTGKPHCFFQTRMYARHSGFRLPAQAPDATETKGQHIQLAPLEDADAIQIAISQVINALASGQLEPRRASVLLYGLQMASSNSRRLRCSPSPSTVVRSVQLTPEGLDIAEPGTLGEDFRRS